MVAYVTVQVCLTNAAHLNTFSVLTEAAAANVPSLKAGMSEMVASVI